MLKLTSRFMNWYQGNNDREKEPPRSGLRRVGFLIWNFAGRFILANLVFLASCLPVVTIPAAIAASNRYLGIMWRDGYGFSFEDYRKEFKSDFLKTMPIGAFSAALLLYACYLMSLAGNFGKDGAPLMGFGIGAAIFGILTGAYGLVLASMTDLPVKYLMKNAFILMIAEWRTSAAVTVLTAVYAAVFILTMPYSLPLLLLTGFSIYQLMIYSLIEKTVKKRVIRPV
jgi:hypothetical protein